MKRMLPCLLGALLLACVLHGNAAEPGAPSDQAAPPVSTGMHIRPVDDAWRSALPRDPDAATQAYLDRLSPQAVARSNAYFEGGYWLLLWNLLATLAVSSALLGGRRSARLRDACLRLGRVQVAGDALYGLAFSVISFVLTLPLAVYQGFVREHDYGMATQTFGPWLGEQLIGLLVNMVLAAVAVVMLYAMLRRVRVNWWGWATCGTMLLMTLLVLVGPVLIDPLFNTYQPLEPGPVRTAVLAMAHADGVPVDDVLVFDASRQTTRVSANVSGIFGTAAVRLNDNLMRATPPEIRSVMGHELGHYVLNHIYKMLAEFALLFLLAYRIAQWAMAALLRRHGARLGVTEVQDVASFPLLVGVLALLAFLATPITNTLIRQQEIEADRFGLNLAREPHGEAEVDLKLTEYRKPDPAPWEEFVFFDHPSTRFRIHDAMRWRAAMGTP